METISLTNFQTKTVIKNQVSSKEIEAFLIRELASILEVNENDIETDVAFDRYGIDSSAAVQLTGKLSKFVDKTLGPTLLYDFPTIDSLSKSFEEN